MLNMEFHKKIQELRKQKGLTQEELAQALYVSRTAISKWESGRGYPNIDSIKAIAKFFSVTVDDLLSGDELLTLAEEDHKEKSAHAQDLLFGSLDLSNILFLFLPLFAQATDGVRQAVSLLSLTEIGLYLKISYFAITVSIICVGFLTLALQNCRNALWVRNKSRISLLLNVMGVLLFIASLQPYAATFLFAFLIIKVSIFTKKQ